MPTRRRPRKGSLQFWPRKRARKMIPSVNWEAINSGKKIKGFIGYKCGMFSALVVDNTPNSMTKDKEIIVPITIIECPPMKILSVRFYKNNKVTKDILLESLDKELKKRIKLPKKSVKKIEEMKEEYDNISLIVYSQVKKTGIKKSPDIAEVGLNGNLEEKLNFVKENMNKEILIEDVFDKGQIIDLRGINKGKGFSGPVKRFGIKLKSHKSEKGRRRPGSLGPWHPARVTFRVPMAGQLGMFTRVHYNQKILDLGKTNQKDNLKNIKNYGNIKTEYILISGSVQGPSKRQIFLTAPLRPSKSQTKKQFEFLELKR